MNCLQGICGMFPSKYNKVENDLSEYVDQYICENPTTEEDIDGILTLKILRIRFKQEIGNFYYEYMRKKYILTIPEEEFELYMLEYKNKKCILKSKMVEKHILKSKLYTIEEEAEEE